jgi:putative ABC transport system permease protein
MLTNHFRSAFRQFRKNKISTGINIIGLFVGISASLIIFMIVKYDYSFDKQEPGSDRIYRVVSDGEGWKSQGVPVPFVPALTGRVSGVEMTAPIFDFNDRNIKVTIPKGSNKPDEVFKKQEKIVFADAGYFTLFPHTWLAGNPASAFKQPYTVVLSESRAKTYFPGVPVNELIG